jgi:hypothetical protein
LTFTNTQKRTRAARCDNRASPLTWKSNCLFPPLSHWRNETKEMPVLNPSTFGIKGVKLGKENKTCKAFHHFFK